MGPPAVKKRATTGIVAGSAVRDWISDT